MTTTEMVDLPSHTDDESRLRDASAAVRLSFTWMGARRTLTPQQKAVAAESFGAEGEFLSAGKKLLDTKHPKFKALTAIRGEAVARWKSASLPWPETGIRLIHRDQIEEFDNEMHVLSGRLENAVVELDDQFDELRSTARDRLGSLFNPSDYPASLNGAFSMSWDFPSVDPPGYLQQVNPELYEQECSRVRSQFAEAVRLAEEAFTAELSELISHLCERLEDDDQCSPLVSVETSEVSKCLRQLVSQLDDEPRRLRSRLF